MKKHIGKATIVSIALLASVLAGLGYYSYNASAGVTSTYHSGWHLIRDTNDQDGDTFAAVYNLTTDGDFASKKSSSVADGGPFRVPSMNETENTKWMFAICGKNYNGVDDTLSFNLVGWSRENGMLQNICEGAATLGTQAVVIYPDGGDAMGAEFSVTDANYTHSTETLSVTNGGFDGGVVNTMIYVGSSNETNLTSAYYEVTTFTDANTIVISGASSTDNITAADITVQNNPAFWADTITLDETTKWTSAANEGVCAVINSTDNEVACLVVDLAGLEWIQFVIYDADAATGEEAGDITVYGRRM